MRIPWIVLTALCVIGCKDDRRTGTPALPMELSVTIVMNAVQISNESNTTWDQCRVVLGGGGYTADVGLLRPHGAVEVKFIEFTRRDSSLPAVERFVRDQQEIEVDCAGPDHERHRQTFAVKPR
jgi:hypothetical protein